MIWVFYTNFVNGLQPGWSILKWYNLKFLLNIIFVSIYNQNLVLFEIIGGRFWRLPDSAVKYFKQNEIKNQWNQAGYENIVINYLLETYDLNVYNSYLLRYRKAGRFERMSLTGNSHDIVTRGSRFSRAPPHHTLRGGLPTFQIFIV